MPKREATPPPADDEPKYLTICYPYPPHANMELPGDILALVRWLACCMKTSKDIWAIFHKPSAPNMIIVEVSRSYPGFRQLLGAHKWSEYVKSPGEHIDKITKVFFSVFSNGRAVEKAGWKRIFVNDDWFRGFSPNNKYIAYPYPASTYCDLPSEDLTAYSLCRPIPRDTLPIVQIPAPPPVPVGSAGWVSQKKNPNVSKKPYTEPTWVEKSSMPPRPVLLPELQMPIPSAVASPVLSPGSSTGYNSSGSKGPMGRPSSNSVGQDISSPVSRPQSGGITGGSSGYGSESSFPSDHDSPSSVGDNEGKPYVAGGYFDIPNLEDEFGTLSVHRTTNRDGAPLCPTHDVVCKKGICRDYYDLLKTIEREEAKALFNKSRNDRDHRRGPGPDANGFSVVSHSRGRGSGRARGFSPGRGRGSQRNTALAGGSGW